MNLYLVGQTKGGKTPVDMRSLVAHQTMLNITPERPLRLLLSYHYFKDADLDALIAPFGDTPLAVFCDSGAFSAFSIGAQIDPKEYTAWVRRWQRHFTLVAGPDIIGNPARTESETRRMQDVLPDVRVLPTFHIGEPWEYLERYAAEYPYLALGGMVPHTRNKPLLDAWLTKAFKLIPSTVGVHGFGLTTWSLLLKFPFASVDSSSWTSSVRYASLALFDPARKRWLTLDMNDKAALLQNMRLLHAYGLDTKRANRQSYDRDSLVAACVRAWRYAEEYLNERKAAQGIKPLPVHLVTLHGDGTFNSLPVIAGAIRKARRSETPE